MSIKLYSLLIFIFFTANSVAFSQSQEFVVGSLIGFYGVHIDGEIEKIYSSSHGTFWGTGGVSLGVNIKRNFSDKTYGTIELRYIRKGSIYEFFTDYGIQAYEAIRLDYIELPVLFGYKVGLNKKYLLLETGFAYARLINSKFLVDDLNGWDSSEKLKHFDEDDFSWIAGLKYPIVKNEKLLLGFRFSYSLISTHTVYNLHNLLYGIEICYLFNQKSNR